MTQYQYPALGKREYKERTRKPNQLAISMIKRNGFWSILYIWQKVQVMILIMINDTYDLYDAIGRARYFHHVSCYRPAPCQNRKDSSFPLPWNQHQKTQGANAASSWPVLDQYYYPLPVSCFYFDFKLSMYPIPLPNNVFNSEPKAFDNRRHISPPGLRVCSKSNRGEKPSQTAVGGILESPVVPEPKVSEQWWNSQPSLSRDWWEETSQQTYWWTMMNSLKLT